jgi:hypothetical protein
MKNGYTREQIGNLLVCFYQNLMCKTVHFVVISAEIWCPHRVEVVVFAIFSALSMNEGGGGELTNKNLDGVGEIHQGKRFLFNVISRDVTN